MVMVLLEAALKEERNDYHDRDSLKKDLLHICQGYENCVFGKRCFCPLPKHGGFDENGRNDDLHSTHKTRRFVQAKPPFAQNTIFATAILVMVL